MEQGFQQTGQGQAMQFNLVKTERATLRGQSEAAKASIVCCFVAAFDTDITAGRLRPIIDRALPFAQANEAHRVLAAGENFGKVVLEM